MQGVQDSKLVTTDRERQIAALAHISGTFFPLWVPFLIYVAAKQRQSRFVAAHAWQEVMDGLIWKGILLILMIASLTLTVIRLIYHFQTEWRDFNWSEVLIRIGISLVVIGSIWVWNLIQALVQTRQAYKGVWPNRELKKLAKESTSLPR